MDRLRFDADSDPDPTFHCYDDPYLYLTPSFTHDGRLEFYVSLHAQQFSGKKYSLSLHLIEIDTDPAPDWQDLDADSNPDLAK